MQASRQVFSFALHGAAGYAVLPPLRRKSLTPISLRRYTSLGGLSFVTACENCTLDLYSNVLKSQYSNSELHISIFGCPHSLNNI